ncbi:MAG: metallophosphoesterase [Candidatus Thermoplasmatota archaeon]
MKLIDKILKEGITKVSEEEYLDLIRRADDILEAENLVEKNWNEFFLVGDTHGDLNSAKRPSEQAIKRGVPIIYLGDYVDRGEKQLENLAYVLSLKIQRPEKVILLRGNHETERMNHSYGFYRVINMRYSESLYRKIVDLYDKLPVASVLGDDHYAAHGGIPKGITSLSRIKELDHDDESYEEIFWNDPNEDIKRFEPNFKRGDYHLYGEKAVDEFLTENNLSKIIRAHEVHPKGYKYYFDEKLLSIFSVSGYRGGNRGKYAHVKGTDIELIDN